MLIHVANDEFLAVVGSDALDGKVVNDILILELINHPVPVFLGLPDVFIDEAYTPCPRQALAQPRKTQGPVQPEPRPDSISREPGRPQRPEIQTAVNAAYGGVLERKLYKLHPLRCGNN